MPALAKRLCVEAAGTAWLVFIGCGSVALDGSVALQGTLSVQMAVAFGLAFATAGYACGGGAHLNPALTVGFALAQRFPVRDLLPYIAAQTAGAVAGAALLVQVASGRPGFDASFAANPSAFAANGFGAHSPADYPLNSVLTVEAVLSFAFVLICLLVTCQKRFAMLAPLVCGLCLTLVYLVSIPVTNGSVNPARSTAQALIVGSWALDQLWVFWAAPLAGGVAAGVVFSLLRGSADASLVAPPGGRSDVV